MNDKDILKWIVTEIDAYTSMADENEKRFKQSHNEFDHGKAEANRSTVRMFKLKYKSITGEEYKVHA